MKLKQRTGSIVFNPPNFDDKRIGLVAYYPFDGDVNDHSWHGNDGIMQGAPAFVQGIRGQALSFDGEGDGVGKLDANSAIPSGKPGSNLTISLWLKANSLSNIDDDEAMGIVCYDGRRNNGDDLWQLRLESEKGEQPGGYVWFRTFGGNNGGGNSEIVLIGEWVHVAVVWNVGDSIKVYANGNLDSTVSETDTSEGQADLIIANSYQDSTSYFDGIIDQLRIYNRALSELEIKKLYELKM